MIRAFCKQSDAYSTSGSYLEAPVGQGSATWNLLSGQRLDCEWYNFPAVTPTTAAVNIRLHSCPNGYDGGSATIYDLAANCHGTPNGVKLTLTPFNAPAQNGQTNQNGMIGWQNVPSGKLSIKQQVPSGVTVQRVFCNQRKLTGEELGFAEVAAAPDGTLTDYLFAGFDAYDCDWFNVSDIAVVDGTPEAGATPIAPGGGDQTGTGNGNDNGNGNGTTTGDSGTGTVSQPTPQSNGGSTGATSLTITLFSCPSGYDLFADDADPAADCLEPVSDVDFTSLGGVSGILATKTTDADGIAKYPKLTSGPHLITEQLPADVDFAFILDCSSNLSDYADSPLYPFAFAGPNGEISIDVQKGEQLSCNWYNVPA